MRKLSPIGMLCFLWATAQATGTVSSGGGSHSADAHGAVGAHTQQITTSGVREITLRTGLPAGGKSVTVARTTLGGQDVLLATFKGAPLSEHDKKVIRDQGWSEKTVPRGLTYYCRDNAGPEFASHERQCFTVAKP